MGEGPNNPHYRKVGPVPKGRVTDLDKASAPGKHDGFWYDLVKLLRKLTHNGNTDFR